MDIKDLQKLATHMEGQRQKRYDIWRDLHTYIAPHAGIFSGEVTEKVDVQINPSAQGSLRRGAAGLTSAMTPRGLPWFQLGFVIPDLDEITRAGEWIDFVEEKTSSALAAGGFYQAIHAANQELIAYGCMLLYTELDTRGDVDGQTRTRPRYCHVPIGTYSVALGAFGDVETVCRTLRYTAAQLKEKFGEKDLSQSIQRKLATNPHEAVDVIHIVMPRGKASGDGNKAMPYAAYYYVRGESEILGEAGYNEMPYMFAAWSVGREPVYGTGPGDEALPDAKMLQALETKALLGLDKTIDPPLRKPMGFRGEINALPGAQNMVNAFEQSGIAPLYEVNFISGLNAVSQKILDTQRRIDDTLLASVFSDPYFDNLPNVTATAIIQQRQQKAQLMGPALSAYENTVLSRIIMRTISMLDASGMLPPVPEPLNAQVVLPRDIINIDYISPLSQTLRATNAQATQGLVADVFRMAGATPEVLDKLDLDEIIDVLARGAGAPGCVVRSDQEVQQIRAQRAQIQQQMQQQQQLQAMAQTLIQGGQGLDQNLPQ